MGLGIGIERSNAILQTPLELLSPIVSQMDGGTGFPFSLAVLAGCGDWLFETGDHFLHVTAGHGRVWALWLGGGGGGAGSHIRVRPGPQHHSNSYLTSE